jgi:hypothetical protein
MAYPILKDSHLYGPLKDLRLKFGPYGTWEGGKDVTSFSVWLFPLKGVKAGPLILVETGNDFFMISWFPDFRWPLVRKY